MDEPALIRKYTLCRDRSCRPTSFQVCKPIHHQSRSTAERTTCKIEKKRGVGGGGGCKSQGAESGFTYAHAYMCISMQCKARTADQPTIGTPWAELHNPAKVKGKALLMYITLRMSCTATYLVAQRPPENSAADCMMPLICRCK